MLMDLFISTTKAPILRWSSMMRGRSCLLSILLSHRSKIPWLPRKSLVRTCRPSHHSEPYLKTTKKVVTVTARRRFNFQSFEHSEEVPSSMPPITSPKYHTSSNTITNLIYVIKTMIRRHSAASHPHKKVKILYPTLLVQIRTFWFTVPTTKNPRCQTWIISAPMASKVMVRGPLAMEIREFLCKQASSRSACSRELGGGGSNIRNSILFVFSESKLISIY